MPNIFDALIYHVSPWVVSLVTIVVLLLAAEVGYRLGLWRRSSVGESQQNEIITLQAVIVGFLSLVLGFSFSMSQGRFDTRRRLVVEEANAIETTYLRAQMLPDPYRENMSRLLADYAAARVPRPDAAAIEQAIIRTERLHDLLWKQAISISDAEPNPAVTLLFTESLNEMIDLHTTRVTAYLYRAPGLLLLLLHVAATLAVSVMGYASGLGGRRNIEVVAVMVALVAIVLLLIVDLEQPQAGMIRASQRALIEVRDSLNQATGGDKLTSPHPAK